MLVVKKVVSCPSLSGERTGVIKRVEKQKRKRVDKVDEIKWRVGG
jgi:hypothetical protein